MQNFYRMRADQIKIIHLEVQNQPKDNIKLSKQALAMLLENDHELNPEPPAVNKQQSQQMKDLEKRYRELLYKETQSIIDEEVRAARSVNPIKTSNTTYYVKGQI